MQSNCFDVKEDDRKAILGLGQTSRRYPGQWQVHPASLVLSPLASLPTLPENSLAAPHGASLALEVVLSVFAHRPDGTVVLELVDQRTIATRLWCNVLELVSIGGQNAGKAEWDVMDLLCNHSPGAGVWGFRSKVYDEQEPLWMVCLVKRRCCGGSKGWELTRIREMTWKCEKWFEAVQNFLKNSAGYRKVNICMLWELWDFLRRGSKNALW